MNNTRRLSVNPTVCYILYRYRYFYVYNCIFVCEYTAPCSKRFFFFVFSTRVRFLNRSRISCLYIHRVKGVLVRATTSRVISCTATYFNIEYFKQYNNNNDE